MSLLDQGLRLKGTDNNGARVGGCNSFTAGTKVLTDEGEKPIEDIQVGDKVLAKDDVTGEMAYKEVEWLFQRDVEKTYNITVGNEVITTTDEHPFWIVGKGWVEAQHLKVGDVLTTSDGKELAIEKIEVKNEYVTVYNFKVKDFHTYFVSNLGIWTHNSCGPNGTFENAPYHGTTNSGKKNRAPNDGQTALDNSLSIGPNTDRRIGISDREVVVLDKTSDGLYHGHVRTWSELTPTMQAILRKAGLVDKKGNIK